MIGAQAGAQAYTRQAMAELMRVRAIELATQSVLAPASAGTEITLSLWVVRNSEHRRRTCLIVRLAPPSAIMVVLIIGAIPANCMIEHRFE